MIPLATQYAPIPYTAIVIGLLIALTLYTLGSLLLGLCRAAARPRPRPPSCDEWARRGDLRGGR